jgi:hypothetical protein
LAKRDNALKGNNMNKEGNEVEDEKEMMVKL